MLKGHIASTSKKIKLESYPNLNSDDLDTVRAFSKQANTIIKSMTKQEEEQQNHITESLQKQKH